MTREEFMLREHCIFLTAEIHDISDRIGYFDYLSTNDIFRADLSTFEDLMSKDENAIETLIETLREDYEQTDDDQLQCDIAAVIECLEELKG